MATAPLEVFIVPHTHADTGWMLTVEQYYEQLVRPILTSTLASLTREPHARYCWAEVAFLARWWEEQPQTVRQAVRAAVASGKLELVEGGWSQSDEIVASLGERILNLEAGHDWIGAHIGRGTAFPRLGWKLDPFGGSALSAALFSAQRADAMVKMRIPDWMKRSMQAAGQAELLWRPSARQGGSGDSIFLHVMESYSGASGQGFDFDQYRTPSPPITPATVGSRAQVFASLAMKWAQSFGRSAGSGRGGRRLLMLPWGGDFRWQNGSYWFGNMSLLMDHVHAHSGTFGGMRLRFATPSEYFAALHTAAEEGNVSFPTTEHVWQPYDGQSFRARAHPNEYMSGIFDSRTAEKRLTRATATRATAASALRVAAQMRGLRPPSKGATQALQLAKEAVGIGVHHDALPGTSNSGVYTGTDPVHGGFAVEDYKQRLVQGMQMADIALADAVGALDGGWDTMVTPLTRSSTPLRLPARLTIANPASRAVTSVHRVQVHLRAPPHATPAARATVAGGGTGSDAEIAAGAGADAGAGAASVTGAGSGSGAESVVAGADAGVCVYAEAIVDSSPSGGSGGGGGEGTHSLPATEPRATTPPLTSQLTWREDEGVWELAFLAHVPPLASRSYLLMDGNCSVRVIPQPPSPWTATATFPVRGACVSAVFNRSSGRLTDIVTAGGQPVGGQAHRLSPSFYAYTNATRSGSYFFVPSAVATPMAAPATYTVLVGEGPVLSEVSSIGSDGLGQRVTVRALVADELACSVRLQATVARPIAYNSELVLRFHSAVNNRDGALLTHNSHTAERWTANASVGVGGNYHTAVSHAALVDADCTRSLMIAFDRTHGVASLGVGELEVKLQRNVGGDGEGPACNDTEPVSAMMEVSVAATTTANQSTAGRSAAGCSAAASADEELRWLRTAAVAFDEAPLPFLIRPLPRPHSRASSEAPLSPLAPLAPSAAALVNASVLPASVRVLSWGTAPALGGVDVEGADISLPLSCDAVHAEGGAALLRLVNDGMQPARLDLLAFLRPAPILVDRVCESTISGHRLASSVIPMQWRPSDRTTMASSRQAATRTDGCLSSTTLHLLPHQLRTVRICWRKARSV